MQRFVKFVRSFLTRKLAALLWFGSGFVHKVPGYGIAALFAKHAAIQQMRHISTAKGTAILGLWRFTRRRTAVRPSKCGAHSGRRAAHMPPCFQVLLRHVCFILFDANRS